MLRRGEAIFMGTMVVSLVFAGCQGARAVEVVNPCSERVVVDLWETPTPRGVKSDRPTRVIVPRSAPKPTNTHANTTAHIAIVRRMEFQVGPAGAFLMTPDGAGSQGSPTCARSVLPRFP